MLIGQRCNFSFDMGGPGPGILYAAKKGLTGSHPARILAAIEWCLALSNLLVAEEEFPPGVRLRTDSLELRFQDRLETPNTAAPMSNCSPPSAKLWTRCSAREITDWFHKPTGTRCTDFRSRQARRNR